MEKARGWKSPGNGQGTAYTHMWCGKDHNEQGIKRNKRERQIFSERKKKERENNNPKTHTKGECLFHRFIRFNYTGKDMQCMRAKFSVNRMRVS